MISYPLAKRTLDVFVASVALVASAPLMAVIAWLIKREDGGPVLYVHSRVGERGRLFAMLKFRTMQPSSPDIRNPDGSTVALRDDPRVTRIGRLLRSASLDELPQLWNVLRGDLSLVGPRPDLPDQLKLYEPRDFERLTVKPGISGWAQVHGRNGLPWQRRRELDVEYVRRRGMLLDVRILLRTVPLVLRRRGVFANEVEVESSGD